MQPKSYAFVSKCVSLTVCGMEYMKWFESWGGMVKETITYPEFGCKASGAAKVHLAPLLEIGFVSGSVIGHFLVDG